MFKTLFLVLISTALINNVVLSQFLGICPFLGVSRSVKTAAGMGGAVIFVITISSAVTNLLYTGVIQKLGLDYLKTIVFILVIAAIVQFIEMFLKKFVPKLHKALGVYLPLITTNCAVLGVTILNIDNGYTFGQSIVDALGAGLGFTLALLIFSGVRSRVEKADVPETFKGVPATLIAASIVSVSFMSFSGMVEGIFG